MNTDNAGTDPYTETVHLMAQALDGLRQVSEQAGEVRLQLGAETNVHRRRHLELRQQLMLQRMFNLFDEFETILPELERHIDDIRDLEHLNRMAEVKRQMETTANDSRGEAELWGISLAPLARESAPLSALSVAPVETGGGGLPPRAL